LAVRRVSAVTHLQRGKGNIELFRGDLLKSCLQALAELGLTGEQRDSAVGIDANPGIKVWRCSKATRRLGRDGWRGLILGDGVRQSRS